MSAKVTLNEISPTERSFSVEIPRAMLDEQIARKTSEYHKKVRLPGFREGHVPQKMIAARFGEAIRHEALEALVDSTINEELRKSKLRPVDRGTVEDFADDGKGDVRFTFKFEVDAEIEVKDYADLGIKADPVEVADAEVEDELHKLQHRLSEEVPVDRAAAEGDVVRGTYLSIVIGGERQPLAENPEFRMALGVSQLKELEQGIVGLKKGDEKSVEFVFPEEYPNDEIKGKKATYSVRIEEVLEVRLPEADDAMAEKVGKKNMDELRADIRRQIEAYKRHVANLLKKEEDPTEEEMKQNRESAENAIRRYRILDWIANKENVRPTQEEVDGYLREMAAGYGVPFEALKEHLRTGGRMAEIREEMRLGKTMDWLIGIRPEAAK